MPIGTKVVSSNPTHGKVYSIHYMIKFVSDLWQASAFLESGVQHHNPNHIVLITVITITGMTLDFNNGDFFR